MKRTAVAMFSLTFAIIAATAQTPVATPVGPLEAVPATVAVEAVPAEAVQTPAADTKVADANRNCIRQTGSMLTRDARNGKCNGQPGRSYSRDDIQGTGAASTADALRMLDTSVR